MTFRPNPHVEPSRWGGSLSERVALNHQILDNPYWSWPVESKGHENYVPVGRSPPTSPMCGEWQSFYVCEDVVTHKGVVYHNVDYTNKVAVSHGHLWCHSPSCCKCFIRGWSARLAQKLAGRMEVLSERFSADIEHVTVSPSKEYHSLPEPVLRERSRLALLNRGFYGGSMIFHGHRMDRERKVLVWSPHYHVLGIIRGGFDVCRNCGYHTKEDCASCPYFKGREVREFAKDHILVKVFEKRKTVVGTAFYQLNHATIRVGLRRFHVVTHFGVGSNRNLKGRKPVASHECPVCRSVAVHNDMVRSAYVGKEFIARDIGSSEYRKLFAFEQFDGSGLPNFVPLRSRGAVE